MDISKLIVRFAHVINMNEDTSTKTRLDYARVLMGCKKLAAISRRFTVVLEKQMSAITIEINYKIEVPGRGSSTTTAEINSNKIEVTIESVGDENWMIAGKICPSDWPIVDIVNLPTGKRGSYTGKRVLYIT